MTRHEFIEQVARRVAANWPHAAWPDTTVAKIYGELADFPADQVLAAVEVRYRDGERFPPTGGQILQTLADLTVDAPAWGDAWATIRRALAHSPRYHPGRVRADLEGSHPAVHALVDQVGLLALLEVEGDPAAFAQCRERYGAIVTGMRRRLTWDGIPAAALPALERVKRQPLPVAGPVEQLAKRVTGSGCRR